MSQENAHSWFRSIRDRQPGRLGRRRILVVDSEPSVRASLATLLARAGHAVRLASTGHQALAMTAALQPDIIFLATSMPDVDSTALCRLLKRQLTRPAHLYALSSRHDDDLERRCLEAGFHALLVTPISATQLSTLDQSAATG